MLEQTWPFRAIYCLCLLCSIDLVYTGQSWSVLIQTHPRASLRLVLPVHGPIPASTAEEHGAQPSVRPHSATLPLLSTGSWRNSMASTAT